MPGTIDHATATLKFDVLQLGPLDLATAEFQVFLDWTIKLANGVGAGQVSQVFTDTRTLGASATENLDLAGSLTNAIGAIITLTKVKLIAVRAAAANNAANNVNVQRHASAGPAIFLAVNDGVGLTPGAIYLHFDPTGITVTPTTADLITFTNSAGTNPVSYDVVVLGTD